MFKIMRNKVKGNYSEDRWNCKKCGVEVVTHGFKSDLHNCSKCTKEKWDELRTTLNNKDTGEQGTR